MVKNRLAGDDLFVYKLSDSSVTLSPPPEKKLEPCEIISLILLVYKGKELFKPRFLPRFLALEYLLALFLAIFSRCTTDESRKPEFLG